MYYAERLTSGNLLQPGFDEMPDLVGIGASAIAASAASWH